MITDQVGAIITSGPSDWQIFQQDETGVASISLSGQWVSDTPGVVQVRLVFEDTAVAVTAALNWRNVDTRDDHAWSIRLDNIPAGGLYRLETRLNPAGNIAGEWSTRGDMRHFLGVGDLWVITGQSNSAGYGRGPVYDPPELGVHLLRNSEQWALATHPMNESTDTRHPVNREGANSAHSPYLHFARLLKQRLNYPIGLVQAALGGSALAPWNPTETKSAVLFNNMVHCVGVAGGHVKGIIWYQGESDANEIDGATYAERFVRAVGAWREALHSPALPVITVQLNRVHMAMTPQSNLGWSLVREAQRRLPHMTDNVAVVPALDLPLSDGIHISPAGNLLLADRMARVAEQTVYGMQVDGKAPEISAADRVDDGLSVRLIFTNVTSRMDTIDPTAVCFTVEDKNGDVEVETVTYPGDASIVLKLGRALIGNTVVHGAFGIDPPIAPCDMERFIPMLGFYGIKVE
jgi:sialate O-acetylesterase